MDLHPLEVTFCLGTPPSGVALGSATTTTTLYSAQSEVVVLSLASPPPNGSLASTGGPVDDAAMTRAMVPGPTSLAFLALAVTSDAFATEPPLPAPWNHLGANLAEAFGGTNLVWHGAGIASTVVLAESGGDHEARTWVRRNVHARGFADATVVGGYVLPAIVAPGVYAIGLTTGDRKTAYAGAAAVQSLTITVVTVGMLKWGTGRPFPNNGRDPLAPDALDHPEDARLAALEPFGEHWIMAWPSGHTAATISIAAALYGFAPEHAWLGWVGYPLALALGAGMIVGDHHWTSDVVAGGMLGHAVGYSTGRGFRRAFDGSSTPEAAAVHPVIHAVQPLTLGAGGWGLGIAGTL